VNSAASIIMEMGCSQRQSTKRHDPVFGCPVYRSDPGIPAEPGVIARYVSLNHSSVDGILGGELSELGGELSEVSVLSFFRVVGTILSWAGQYMVIVGTITFVTGGHFAFFE
jgi:hypothetical protein